MCRGGHDMIRSRTESGENARNSDTAERSMGFVVEAWIRILGDAFHRSAGLGRE